MAADSKPTTQNQGEATPAPAPRSLSLLAQEEFGDDFHGDVEQPPKPQPIREPPDDEPLEGDDLRELPEIPDEDLEEGGENRQVEGDEVDASKPEAETEEPIATVRELVEHLEADPAWFDQLKVDVKVNDKTSQVPLRELIDNYQIREAADDELGRAKTKSAQAQQELAAREAFVEAEYQKAAGLSLMQEQELNAEIASINWDELYRTDPAQWSAERMRLGEKQQRVRLVQQQVKSNWENHLSQRHQEVESNRKAVQTEQSQLLREAIPKISPDWSDPQVDATGRLMKYLVGNGISPEEIEKTMNHKAFIIAEKARLWDESQKKMQVTKKRVQSVPRMMKPGARKEPSVVNLEKVKNAQKQLRNTGRMDDALALLRARQNRR